MERVKLFFNPSSVALIGATDREDSVGHRVLENLLSGKDKRKVYPVNPNREKILDIKCYASVRDMPEIPELAVIVTPAGIVPNMVEECGKSGIKAIIIISAGFKEIGKDGEALEARILELAKLYGMRIIGPNCLGVI